MAKIIDGLSIANEFCDGIRTRVDEIKARGVYPRLAVINANGDDPLINIMKVAESVGIEIDMYQFDAQVNSQEIADLISQLNKDSGTHGISLKSHLPKSVRFRELINLIEPDKDVEGLTTLNQGRLFSGEPGIVPCTPLGVLHLIRTIHEEISGLRAVVLGRSSIVGRPLAQLLLNSNCTVTLLHSYSHDLPEICRNADILVSAMGHPRFVTEEFVKEGATVIDVGINKIEEDGKLKIVGDVDFGNVASVAKAITPVPNGVGPMTVAYLMHNTLKLACCY
ncbi:MAG: bifunctional methylenetetrahydrofolate dehydrogenase/methenyltetrahydrofolate cyclohydrolase [Alphaproteobacteria bacterium]|nr:bifunctional methylenetetrahydrofolate dehydrogenase/methenyltetrahydrofolate cyclohydrolase [Alphaproteobacteria bacterium]